MVLGLCTQLALLDGCPHKTFSEEDEVECSQSLNENEIVPAKESTVEMIAVEQEAVEVPLTSWNGLASYEDMVSTCSVMMDGKLSTLLLVVP